jgi:phospholipid/cholesterol/gamma-HCH transport system substrate-binding protein
MLISEKDKKNVIISGFFLIFLSIIAMISIFLLSKESSLFDKKITLHTKVSNAQGLKMGAAVKLKGIKIGTIKNIEFIDLKTIEISFGLSHHSTKWIKKNSHIQIKTQGVLGDKFMEILGGTEDAPIVTDHNYLTTQQDSHLDSILSKTDGILLNSNKLITQLNRVLETVESNNLKGILTNLNRSSQSLDKLLSEKNVKNFEKTMANMSTTSSYLSDTSKQIKKGPGTLHSLIYDKTIHDDLKALLGGSNRNKVLKYFIRETIKKNDSQ